MDEEENRWSSSLPSCLSLDLAYGALGTGRPLLKYPGPTGAGGWGWGSHGFSLLSILLTPPHPPSPIFAARSLSRLHFPSGSHSPGISNASSALLPYPLSLKRKRNGEETDPGKSTLGDWFLRQGVKMGKVGDPECCLAENQGAPHPVTPCLMDFTVGQ